MEEKIQIDVSVKLDDKEAKKDAKIFARDTKKELDKNLLLELRLNKAKLKLELDEARRLLRKAKEKWDKDLILKLQIKTDKLRSELTEAWRQLNNYVNTWNVKLSRLQAKFDSLKFSISSFKDWLFRLWWAIGWALAWAFSLKGIIELW